MAVISMETSQMLCCALYGLSVLALAMPLAVWWERRHP